MIVTSLLLCRLSGVALATLLFLTTSVGALARENHYTNCLSGEEIAFPALSSYSSAPDKPIFVICLVPTDMEDELAYESLFVFIDGSHAHGVFLGQHTGARARVEYSLTDSRVALVSFGYDAPDNDGNFFDYFVVSLNDGSIVSSGNSIELPLLADLADLD